MGMFNRAMNKIPTITPIETGLIFGIGGGVAGTMSDNSNFGRGAGSGLLMGSGLTLGATTVMAANNVGWSKVHKGKTAGLLTATSAMMYGGYELFGKT